MGVEEGVNIVKITGEVVTLEVVVKITGEVVTLEVVGNRDHKKTGMLCKIRTVLRKFSAEAQELLGAVLGSRHQGTHLLLRNRFHEHQWHLLLLPLLPHRLLSLPPFQRTKWKTVQITCELNLSKAKAMKKTCCYQWLTWNIHLRQVSLSYKLILTRQSIAKMWSVKPSLI